MSTKVYVLRHGLSVPNERCIIVSSPANGVRPEFGLSDAGKQQVAERVSAIAKQMQADGVVDLDGVLFISSPFTRARETAEIVASALKAPSVVDARLRERNFGSLELQPDSGYENVWREDAAGKDESSSFGAESLSSVWSRVKELLAELPSIASCNSSKVKAVVLVAHGDVLQITLAAVAGMELKQHRSLPHMHQAELRGLALRGRVDE